ncbi:hypothetical protein CyaNS01_02122 [Cyanobium sp. NS01]|nr:hypothetical protein CyaNS01_02122 [Cyanobium sp. NS01]
METVNQLQKQRLHRLISQHFGGGAGLAGRRFAVWIDPKALADGRLTLAATKEEATEWKRYRLPSARPSLSKDPSATLLDSAQNHTTPGA